MNSEESESFEIDRIDREAASWVAKKMGGFSPAEQDSFFEWLAADPRHAEWYGKHRKTWKNLDLLAEWMPEHSNKPNQDLLKNRPQNTPWKWLGAIAALFLVGLYLWNSNLQPNSGLSDHQDLVANIYESHSMNDGSIIELNRGAALKVDYQKDLRRIELVSNEAHFEVAKDADRPFVVIANGVEIHAIGTAFNVRIDGDQVEVLVTEGNVLLYGPEEGDSRLSIDPLRYQQNLTVGEMSVVPIQSDAPKPQVVNVTPSEMNRLLSWKPELLEFDSTPLSEAVSEFNRRNQTQIKIEGETLKDTTIVASFRSANVDHFVELIELTLNVQVERPNESLIVLRTP